MALPGSDATMRDAPDRIGRIEPRGVVGENRGLDPPGGLDLSVDDGQVALGGHEPARRDPPETDDENQEPGRLPAPAPRHQTQGHQVLVDGGEREDRQTADQDRYVPLHPLGSLAQSERDHQQAQKDDQIVQLVQASG